LLVDANPDPYFVADTDLGPRSVSERRTSFDAAYTLDDRPPMTLSSDYDQSGNDQTTVVPGGKAKSIFRDRIGVTPGVLGAPGGAAFIDTDAGLVLPSRDQTHYAIYWDFFGDLGNPGLHAGIGVNLAVLDQAEDGTWGRIRFWKDTDTVFVDVETETQSGAALRSAEALAVGDIFTYTVTIKEASGSRYADGMPYTYGATFIDELPDGAVFTNGVNVVYGTLSPPGNAAFDGDKVIWSGTIGGNRLDEPDAIIQYAIVISDATAFRAYLDQLPQEDETAALNCVTLNVQQRVISEDTDGQPLATPFLWPKQSTYGVCSANNHLYLPIMTKQ
jgi:hypothetical protein